MSGQLDPRRQPCSSHWVNCDWLSGPSFFQGEHGDLPPPDTKYV